MESKVGPAAPFPQFTTIRSGLSEATFDKAQAFLNVFLPPNDTNILNVDLYLVPAPSSHCSANILIF